MRPDGPLVYANLSSGRWLRQIFDGVMLMVLQLGFVFDDLAIQLVDQQVDGGV